MQFLNVTHDRQEAVISGVIKIRVMVKTKNIEIIRSATNSNEFLLLFAAENPGLTRVANLKISGIFKKFFETC